MSFYRQICIIVLFIWFALFSFPGPVHASEKQYNFQRISPYMGLNYSSVRCILQDRFGFIWVGTGDGLYRYDTRDFVPYTHENGAENTIPSNGVNGLVLDRNDRLWIATQNGLCIYESISDSFIQFRIQGKHLYSQSVHMIEKDLNEDIWVLDNLGVGKLLEDQMLIEYLKNPVSPDQISSFHIDDNGLCWIGTVTGDLYTYSLETNQFIDINQSEKIEDQITHILNDGTGIWLGYDNSGLVKLDYSGSGIARFNNQSSGKYHLSGNRIRDILQDTGGNLWIATFPGIHIIRNNQVDTILVKENVTSLPDNSVWSFYQDSQDNIWIGTFLGGICLHTTYNSGFYHYDAQRYQVGENFISSFCKGDDGNIWIGTERDGLFSCDNRFREFSRIKIRDHDEDALNIKSIHCDRNQTIWIGTYNNGLWYKRKGNDEFSLLNEIPRENSKIFSIVSEEKGLWIGSYQYGLYYYDTETRKVINYSNQLSDKEIAISQNVRIVYKDREGTIWAGSDDLGLSRKPKDAETFSTVIKHVKDVTSNIIYCIHEDRNQRKWIGTNGDGVIILDAANDSIVALRKRNGFPGNEVYSIIEDQDHYIWLSTENGLCKVDPDTREIRKIINKKTVQINYNPGASYCLEDGSLLFGGTNGFVVIADDHVRRNEDSPEIIFTRFTINNEEANVILEEDNRVNINLADTLRFSHRHNTFGFEIAATNYFLPEKNKFRYRLLGYHDDWLTAESKASVNYLNVPAGVYTFECYASNNDGVWTPEPKTIRIWIKPVFWRSTIACVLYGLLFAAIIWAIYYINRKNQRLRNEFLFEKVRRENEERLHNMKIKFFTNISHELRSPLTLIIGPLKRSFETRKVLETSETKLIYLNASKLLRLINQILQFRKIETEEESINYTREDIISFVREIYDCFTDEARTKGIHMLFQPDVKHHDMYFDKEKTENILNNLFSNAIKFTPAGKTVICRIFINETITESIRHSHSHVISSLHHKDFIEISLEDEGPGIEKDMISNVFRRFSTIKTHGNYGAGIGLSIVADLTKILQGEITVSSTENTGSVFALKLPLLKAEDLKKEEQIAPAHHVPSTKELQYPHGTSPVITSVQKPDPPDLSKKKDIKKELTYSFLKTSDYYVVIIEDDMDVLNYIGSVLDPYFVVYKESSPLNGLATIKKMVPDIIISDIMMPDMNGFDLCEKVKSDITISHIPFIFLTALSSMEDQVKGMQYGAVDYISKPFDEEIVLLKVFNLLKDQKLLRESFITDYSFWKKKIAGSTNENHFINNIKSIIVENIRNTEFDSSTLADRACLSRSQCYRKIKMLTDQSPTEFIKYIRIQEAVKLMKQGETNIQSIGFEVGFNSHSYFTRSFKKIMEVSPTEYISRLWKHVEG